MIILFFYFVLDLDLLKSMYKQIMSLNSRSLGQIGPHWAKLDGIGPSRLKYLGGINDGGWVKMKWNNKILIYCVILSGF